MIRVLGSPGGPVPRLLATLGERGHPVEAATASLRILPPDTVLVVGPDDDPALLRRLPRAESERAALRVLVVGYVGTHPDAPSPTLQRLWTLEEEARASGAAVLALRLAPLVGPRAPLWLHLGNRPRLPRAGRMLLNPVLESDAVETLDRALSGRVAWEGWFEVAGREAVTLAELSEWARAAQPSPAAGGAWEPPRDVIEAQRLCDPDPWIERFGIEPARLSTLAPRWAA